jgi:beta-glucosidase
MAHHFLWISPHDAGSDRDRQTAAFMDDGVNRFFMDPLFFGRYPETVISRMGRFLPRGFEKDLPGMKRPGDFIGLNYYTRKVYRYARFKPFTHAKEVIDLRAGRSAMWEIYPHGMRGALGRLKEEYGNPPCIITENGFPLPDSPGKDPHDDPQRISYLTDHISMVGKAIEAGVDCRGYFHWSLMDNWEWDKGFEMRFGLVRVDFATQRRTWKKSASWYRDLIRNNALEAESTPPLEA